MRLVIRQKVSVGEYDLKEGDIIEFERAGGLYFHCGIYDGHGQVIHRSADPEFGSGASSDSNGFLAIFGILSNKAEIRKDDLRLVAGSSAIYRTNMFDQVRQHRSGRQTLEWAEARIGQKGYNCLFKNCQHFCTEARYGTPLNMQVEKYFGTETRFRYKHNRVEVKRFNVRARSFEIDLTLTTEEKMLLLRFAILAGPRLVGMLIGK